MTGLLLLVPLQMVQTARLKYSRVRVLQCVDMQIAEVQEKERQQVRWCLQSSFLSSTIELNWSFSRECVVGMAVRADAA